MIRPPDPGVSVTDLWQLARLPADGVWPGTLHVQPPAGVKELRVTGLLRVQGALVIQGGPDVREVVLSRLTVVAGAVRFEDMPALRTVRLDALEETARLELRGCPALVALDAPRLTTASTLEARHAHALSRVVLAAGFTGGIHVPPGCDVVAPAASTWARVETPRAEPWPAVSSPAGSSPAPSAPVSDGLPRVVSPPRSHPGGVVDTAAQLDALTHGPPVHVTGDLTLRMDAWRWLAGVRAGRNHVALKSAVQASIALDAVVAVDGVLRVPEGAPLAHVGMPALHTAGGIDMACAVDAPVLITCPTLKAQDAAAPQLRTVDSLTLGAGAAHATGGGSPEHRARTAWASLERAERVVIGPARTAGLPHAQEHALGGPAVLHFPRLSAVQHVALRGALHTAALPALRQAGTVELGGPALRAVVLPALQGCDVLTVSDAPALAQLSLERLQRVETLTLQRAGLTRMALTSLERAQTVHIVDCPKLGRVEAPLLGFVRTLHIQGCGLAGRGLRATLSPAVVPTPREEPPVG